MALEGSGAEPAGYIRPTAQSANQPRTARRGGFNANGACAWRCESSARLAMADRLRMLHSSMPARLQELGFRDPQGCHCAPSNCSVKAARAASPVATHAARQWL